MLEYLQYRNPNSKNKVSHLVIMLHGYGANGANLISLARDFHQSLPDAHFISPNAIEPWEGGFPDCYQWFSLYDKMERRKFEDIASAIKKSNDILKNFIELELKKLELSYKDLFLMGFSQGAMMAIYQGLAIEEKIAGVVSFSGRVILPEMIMQKTNSKPDICLIHGQEDSVLPFENFIEAKKILSEVDVPYQAHEVKGLDHAIDIHCVRYAQNFIKNLTKN